MTPFCTSPHPELEEEESTNYSTGIVWTPGDAWSITLDYYDITIEDRVALATNTIDESNVDDLIDAGVENAELLVGSNANFFVNGFESNIFGIDLSWTTSWEAWGGDMSFDLRHNYNEHEVKNVAPGTLSPATIYDFENQVPQNRTVMTLDYDSGGAFSGFARLNNYGSWGDSGGQLAAGDNSEAVSYGSEFLVDIEATWRFNDMFAVSVGGENVFDTEPDADGHFVAELLGVRTALTSPFGNNGGFWYVRLAADFN